MQKESTVVTYGKKALINSDVLVLAGMICVTVALSTGYLSESGFSEIMKLLIGWLGGSTAAKKGLR